MYKHILIPTDGSELSRKAVDQGIGLAKALNAKVTAVTVSEPFHIFAVEASMVTDTPDEYKKRIAALTAKKRGCDAIVMASHGRRGVSAIVLGSETVKVLTHSNIPVVVVRG